MNGETLYVMIKAAQYHPVTEEVMHVDLMRVRRTEKMTFSIPVILEGEAAGSNEGGLVAQVASSIDIECFPTDVPENISLAVQKNNIYAVSVLSGNRNFEGRISPHVKANYLASPPLVVAYALAGHMEFDLYKDSFGKDQNGKDILIGKEGRTLKTPIIITSTATSYIPRGYTMTVVVFV